MTTTIRERAAADVARLWEARMEAFRARNRVYAAWLAGDATMRDLNPAEGALAGACHRHAEAEQRETQLRRLDGFAARAVARQGAR